MFPRGGCSRGRSDLDQRARLATPQPKLPGPVHRRNQTRGTAKGQVPVELPSQPQAPLTSASICLVTRASASMKVPSPTTATAIIILANIHRVLFVSQVLCQVSSIHDFSEPSKWPQEIGVILIPILQMRKLKQRLNNVCNISQ